MTVPSPNNIYFTLGIPISAIHIESNTYGRTDYDDFVEIWYDEDDKCYAINVRGLDITTDINKFTYHHYSKISRILIFYI